ncbi:sialin [Tetranychus urticae]|uniref:Major facilitator superfamily (MFS) profile domain-containing protein n=1 Tax=Tetranychus urticae TaxID=32264 RepID=T1KH48_TETUR|nr:sialin [Tetranychus urticae]
MVHPENQITTNQNLGKIHEDDERSTGSSNDSSNDSHKVRVPFRFYIAVLGLFSSLMCFSVRTIFSLAILDMLESPSEILNATGPPRPYKVRWTEEEQGIVLGAYSYTYAALQIICGRLSDKYDAAHVSTVAHILSLLCTALTPLSVYGGLGWAIAIRLVQGVVQAPIISTLYVIFARWFPPNEVGLPIAGVLIGSNVGSAMVMPITAWLCPLDQYWEGWPLSFYLFASLNALFVIFWMIFVTKNPKDNKWISQAELELISSTRKDTTKKKMKVNWSAMLLSLPLWSVTIARAANSFAYMLMNFKAPQYLQDELNFNLKDNGFINGLFYIAIMTTMFASAPASQWLIEKGYFSVTTTRKIFEFICNTGCAISTILIPFTGEDPWIKVFLLVMLMFMRGFSTAGDQSIISEMAPDASGLAFGISNTFSSAMGFLAPLIAGLIIDANAGSAHPWDMVWISSGIVSLIGGTVFVLFATAEPQPWGTLDYEPGKSNKKRAVGRETSVIPSSEVYHVEAENLTLKRKKKEVVTEIYTISNATPKMGSGTAEDKV